MRHERAWSDPHHLESPVRSEHWEARPFRLRSTGWSRSASRTEAGSRRPVWSRLSLPPTMPSSEFTRGPIGRRSLQGPSRPPKSASWRSRSPTTSGRPPSFAPAAPTQAGRLALADGRAVHLGGGFHHALADHGEGFCLLNDIAIAAATLLAEGATERIAVVDLDVHHGNGTAAIFADEPRVFTFSMHHQWNYPALKPPGDLDVGLEDGVGDEEYLGLLREHLPRILEEFRPELILYLAGADPVRSRSIGGASALTGGPESPGRVGPGDRRRSGCGRGRHPRWRLRHSTLGYGGDPLRNR